MISALRIRWRWISVFAAAATIVAITTVSLLQGTAAQPPAPPQAIQPQPGVTFGSIPLVQRDRTGEVRSNVEAAVPAQAAGDAAPPSVPVAEPPPQLLDKTGAGRSLPALIGGLVALMLALVPIVVIHRRRVAA